MTIGGIRNVQAHVPAEPVRTEPAAAPRAAQSVGDWFDMTAWTGPRLAAPVVSVGPALAGPAPLSALSADVVDALAR